jgi:hypothetical protein
MTESAWFSLTKIQPLISHASQFKNERRMTLFGCACCRCAHDWELPLLESKAIKATERFVDGEITRRTWVKHGRMLEAEDGGWSQTATEWDCDFRDAVIQLFYGAALWQVPHTLIRGVERVSSEEYTEAFEVKLCSALRDIFGNPFRPVKFDKRWLTDTALSLAGQMYESRDLGAMPILADALQDAGCEDVQILNHCRDATQLHFRGCWVVDLVLGKA